ncbi:MAG: hypothetical protein OXK80_00420 [Bdellovibrionales bacterium]|nr:hypothetical protein [Bdellovibrionales bacterium]
MKNIHYKVLFLFLLGGASFCVMSEESQDKLFLEGEALEVQTQFPRYRVLYNHQQVVQEVQDQLKSEESDKSDKE